MSFLQISNSSNKVLPRISSENFAILYSISGFTPPYHTGEDYDDNISRKPGNVLKTLDPILITIIAMSALGVLLGAICGVVLYCACWHNGMSERNLSALENYNFELVDGVKLKKDKLNTQNSYSEAWRYKATREVSENRDGRTKLGHAGELMIFFYCTGWKVHWWHWAKLFSGASMSV